MIGWEDLLFDIFRVEEQIEELFAEMVSCIQSKHVTLSTFSLKIYFFNCNILIKGMIWPVCAENAVKPQSITH